MESRHQGGSICAGALPRSVIPSQRSRGLGGLVPDPPSKDPCDAGDVVTAAPLRDGAGDGGRLMPHPAPVLRIGGGGGGGGDSELASVVSQRCLAPRAGSGSDASCPFPDPLAPADSRAELPAAGTGLSLWRRNLSLWNSQLQGHRCVPSTSPAPVWQDTAGPRRPCECGIGCLSGTDKGPQPRALPGRVPGVRTAGRLQPRCLPVASTPLSPAPRFILGGILTSSGPYFKQPQEGDQLSVGQPMGSCAPQKPLGLHAPQGDLRGSVCPMETLAAHRSLSDPVHPAETPRTP